jgi:hypothetical protein
VALASRANAATDQPNQTPDFDADQVAANYYAMALKDPTAWSAGQLLTLEGVLNDVGLHDLAVNVHDMRLGLYGDAVPAPQELPDFTFIPQSEIDAIADQVEAESQ